MEARNQSVDELLLEIDQSIAASRHTMRLDYIQPNVHFVMLCSH